MDITAISFDKSFIGIKDKCYNDKNRKEAVILVILQYRTGILKST